MKLNRFLMAFQTCYSRKTSGDHREEDGLIRKLRILDAEM